MDQREDGDSSRDGGAELELFREPEPDPEARQESKAGGVGGPTRRTGGCRIVAVSGAKGGVGKTMLTSNLAIYLATIGRRVVVADADAEGANLHTFLGIERPGGVISYLPPVTAFGSAEPLAPLEQGGGDVPQDEESPFGAVLVDTPYPGLRHLHAGMDEPPRATARRTRRSRLLSELRRMDADYVVVDLGAGTDRALLDLWLGAELSVFVSVPEPTAVENTYRFIRCAFARQLRAIAEQGETRRRVVRKLRSVHHAPSPLDFARRLEADGDPLASLVRTAMDSFRFRMVLNQTRLRADLELGERMRSATRRRLGVHLDYLGYIDYDDTAWTCVRSRRPLLVESPGTKASKSIEKIARRLLAIDAGKGPAPPLRTVPPETHHDLLEVDRGATDEEIRRAYKRAKDVYAPDALCCYGLFDGAGLEALRARLDEAYDVLLDPARRRPYELSVFPPDPGPEQERPLGEQPTPSKGPPPVITPDTEFTGNLLRAVRESQGIGVRVIGQRTKIGQTYLRAIEEDDFGSLPAPVYVRGFVTEIAKCLKLDPEHVARTYVRRYRRFLEERDKL